MDGVLKRLSTSESEAEGAIRAIAFFERLVAAKAGVDEIVRAAAQLTGLKAGVKGKPGFPSFACTPHGQKLESVPPPGALSRSVEAAGEPVATVWLLESDEVTSLIELILERMAMAAEAVFVKGMTIGAFVGSPVVQLLSRDTGNADRAAAARAIGFHATWPVRAVAVKPAASESEISDSLQRWGAQNAIEVTRVTMDRGVAMCLIHDIPGHREITLPEWGLQVGLGSKANLQNAYESGDNARLALRMTSETLGPAQADFEVLGPLQMIARTDPEDAGASRLVQQLRFLIHTPNGLAEVQALDSFCEHRSLRKASIALNLHHTSVNYRLKSIERKLGITLTDEGSMFALSLALKLLRVAEWSD
ncbi:MAG TPA: helix-turn-helix domain-containing protein [Tepidisphaeraceae bacterium]|nr:helix-turn-helix domain-containing protein [Tepidisphaeraceae bacterium]